ncbi:NUDIX hydrolase [Agromyces salentinus]|uniref:NUDIX domain-containing protein n=1 Tax=Agromyces salentinus TaxID=269421 RepID=A0ABN2ME05_9MICO|nr:NUDIX hydrolase [Agromyces salentinus]
MPGELDALEADPVDGYAATVVLLRDGELGVEVLLARRPQRGSFADAWVFPGGAVDAADVAGDALDGEETARRAAVRETREEVGLDVDADELVPFSHWTPPPGSPKRLRTWFFAARVPEGDLTLAPDEVVAVQWIRPGEVLERHAAGDLTLWPPTWVTLHGLAHAASVDEALDELRSGEIRPFVSRYTDDRTAVLWQEDEAFAPVVEADGAPAVSSEASEVQGVRHRLTVDRLPWVYVKTF